VSTIVVAGTGTEVGKTWWGCATLACLREHGVAVAARKPAQSFTPAELGSTDAELLGATTDEPPDTVCARHRWYEVPMAPPMAADALGRPAFTLADLVADLAPAPDGALCLVEGAGGPRSPIATDGDNVDLATALAPAAVVLVGDAGLGTINAIRLGADAFAGVADGRLVVALNRYDAGDDLHRRNRDWLAGAGFTLVTTPADLADRLHRIS
jgi:dethiobiotin synthetase